MCVEAVLIHAWGSGSTHASCCFHARTMQRVVRSHAHPATPHTLYIAGSGTATRATATWRRRCSRRCSPAGRRASCSRCQVRASSEDSPPACLPVCLSAAQDSHKLPLVLLSRQSLSFLTSTGRMPLCIENTPTITHRRTRADRRPARVQRAPCGAHRPAAALILPPRLHARRLGRAAARRGR